MSQDNRLGSFDPKVKSWHLVLTLNFGTGRDSSV